MFYSYTYLIIQLLTDKHLALRLGKEIEVWLHKPEVSVLILFSLKKQSRHNDYIFNIFIDATLLFPAPIIYVYWYIHICTYICTYIHIYTMCVYIGIKIHICIHMCIHTHTCIHTAYSRLWSGWSNNGCLSIEKSRIQ